MAPLVLSNYNLTLEHLFRKSPWREADEELKKTINLLSQELKTENEPY